MIDERHEELASLYAFDLLDGAELAQFESALARDPELQALVRDLRQASATLAYTAPSNVPPPALKSRVLASVSAASQAVPVSDNIIRPSFEVWRIFPWAVAACFAVGAAWLGQRYMANQSEIAALRNRNELVDIAVKTAEQQLEAERILNRRQLANAQQQLAGANTQLADIRTQLEERDRLIAEARNQLVDREKQIAERDIQLNTSRDRLRAREQEVATLTQRVDALAGASAEIGRQLGESKEQLARVTAEFNSQIGLANLKITALASQLKNSPKAIAVAVWDPKKQEGLLKVENLPALKDNEDYQLWVVDPQYPNPVDGGVFTVEPASGTRQITFKARQPVGAVNAFAVTRERKGGVPKAEGPFVLLGK